MKLLCVLTCKYTFRKLTEGTELGKISETADTKFSSLYRRIPWMSSSAKDIKMLYVTSPPVALPKRQSFFPISSDEETDSARGSDLAKWHRSEGADLVPLCQAVWQVQKLENKMCCLSNEFLVIEGDHLSGSPWKGFNKSSVVDCRSQDLRLWNHRPL